MISQDAKFYFPQTKTIKDSQDDQGLGSPTPNKCPMMVQLPPTSHPTKKKPTSHPTNKKFLMVLIIRDCKILLHHDDTDIKSIVC